MPEYLLSETTVCAHVQTSIKYDYDSLSLYANSITCIVQLSDYTDMNSCERFCQDTRGFCTLEGNEGFTLLLLLLWSWLLLVLWSHKCGKSKDICNAKADFDSTQWHGHNSPHTSSSRPLISACFLSSNEQTHPAAFKTRGKYLTNWSWISWGPKRVTLMA